MGDVISHIIENYISDHRPIKLFWCNADIKVGFPIKFNRVWLKDRGFESLIRTHWLERRDIEEGLTLTERFINRLRNLKAVVKTWERKKKASLRMELIEIEETLKPLHSQMATHSLSVEVREWIHAFKLKKKKILQVREMTWRLKSQATWIREGDKNTKFFHRFANHRRKLNIIWQCWVPIILVITPLLL